MVRMVGTKIHCFIIKMKAKKSKIKLKVNIAH